MINFEALFKISYGLYIVSSGNKQKGNGYISNTVFQITAEPAKFAACCNKNNYTAGLISDTKHFSVSVLHTDTKPEILGLFGYKSGKDVNKMENLDLKYGESGVPIVLNDCIAYLEFKVVETIDVGTHLMFIGELINTELIDEAKILLTYSYYRDVKKGFAPKNAPTYIDKSKLEPKKNASSLKKFKCLACGYIYDESSENITFAELPENWICPACGSEKTDFIEIT